jgi:pimeloyl-ACP methyl ester carboxylesterase
MDLRADPATAGAELTATEHAVPSRSAHDGSLLNLHVFEKRRADRDTADFARPGGCVLLAHGSRRSARVAFDLPVPTDPGETPYSLMDVVAGAGFDVFAVDVQNYGRSDHHPSGLKVTTEVAVADLGAAADFVGKLRGCDQVGLVGWSWGATVVALFAEAKPDRVARVVEFGPRILPVSATAGPLGVPLDQDFYENTPQTSTETFQPRLGTDKAYRTWIDEGVKWDRFSPNGVAADFQTRLPLSEPDKLTVPTMLILGAEDFMMEQGPQLGDYFARIAARHKQFSVLPDGGHAIHLHRGRRLFFDTLTAFLAS